MKILLAILGAVLFWQYVFVKPAPPDLFPMWNAGRAVLHGESPYSSEVTKENQSAFYKPGETIENEQRFAYPLSAVLTVLPLSLLDFQTANVLAVIAMAVLFGFALYRLNPFAMIAFCCWPVLRALQLRQPTILFLSFGLLAISLYEESPLLAGIFASLAVLKPHIGLAIAVPLLIADLHRKGRFALSFCLSGLTLLGISLALEPHWIGDWLATLHAYAGYTVPPSVVLWFGPWALAVSVALVTMIVAVSLTESDPLRIAGISCALAYPLIPWASYNAVLLIPAALWLISKGGRLRGMTIALLSQLCAFTVIGLLPVGEELARVSNQWAAGLLIILSLAALAMDSFLVTARPLKPLRY